MERRSFLKKFFGTAVAVTAASVVAPGVIANCEDPWCGSIAGEGVIPHDELHDSWDGPHEPVVCEYADYADFSEVTRKEAFNEMVQKCAQQLSHNAGKSVQELERVVRFDGAQNEFKFFQKTA